MEWDREPIRRVRDGVRLEGRTGVQVRDPICSGGRGDTVRCGQPEVSGASGGAADRVGRVERPGCGERDGSGIRSSPQAGLLSGSRRGELLGNAVSDYAVSGESSMEWSWWARRGSGDFAQARTQAAALSCRTLVSRLVSRSRHAADQPPAGPNPRGCNRVHCSCGLPGRGDARRDVAGGRIRPSAVCDQPARKVTVSWTSTSRASAMSHNLDKAAPA